MKKSDDKETYGSIIAACGGLEEYKKLARLTQAAARIAAENAKLTTAERIARDEAVFERARAEGKTGFHVFFVEDK